MPQFDNLNWLSDEAKQRNADLFSERGPGKTAVTVEEFTPRIRAERATNAASEKEIQDGMIDLLRLTGWLILRVNGGSVAVDDRYVRFAYWYGPGCESDSGISDIIAMKDARCVLVEVKRPDKRGNLSSNQKLFQQAALDAGVEHYVLCSVEELEAIL